MSTKTQTPVNGVPVDQLVETMRAIRQDPEIAKFQFRAHNEWQDGGHTRVTIKSFYGAKQEDETRTEPFIAHTDEPPVLLSKDKGPNPVEHLLTALSGCLTTSLVYHAAVMGIELESVESRLEGDLDLHGFLDMDPNVRNGYEQIRVVFNIKADAPEEKLDDLVRIAQERSPVFDCVSNPVNVAVTRAR